MKLDPKTLLLGLAAFAFLGKKGKGGGAAPAPAPSLRVPKGGAAVLTFAELRALAASVGIPAEQLDTAAAIALAESTGHPDAIGDQGHSFGLWQINIPAHPEYAPGQALLEPAANAAAMAKVSRGGTYWTPWSTWKDGKFKQYLPAPVAGEAPPAQLAPPAAASKPAPAAEVPRTRVVDVDEPGENLEAPEMGPAIDVEAEVVPPEAAPDRGTRRARRG